MVGKERGSHGKKSHRCPEEIVWSCSEDRRKKEHKENANVFIGKLGDILEKAIDKPLGYAINL